jgi:hypothetical protein
VIDFETLGIPARVGDADLGECAVTPDINVLPFLS